MTSVVNPITAVSRGSSKKKLGAIGFLVAIMSFFLNHSIRAAGFNLSLADPFLIAVLFTFLISSRLYILRYSVLFVSALVGIALSTTLWLTPVALGVQPNSGAVLGDLIKLLISFLYFIAGTSVARAGIHSIALKWFAIGTVFVASLSVFMEVTGVRMFEEILYFGDLRFRGFMSDPNFYSILSCAGFAYFSYSFQYSSFIRYTFLSVLAFSVILSGSKTGMIALVVLIAVILVTRAMGSKRTGSAAFLSLVFLLFLLFLDTIRQYIADLAIHFGHSVPQLNRTASLLSDNPLDSISGGGSSRDAMWSVGLQIIETSPIFGVGIGMYNSVSVALFAQRGVAHNTYIQLAAEWGLILMLIFVVWVVSLLIRSSFHRSDFEDVINSNILREILIVFMIGSVSLSLNNARMLWFFLGMLAYICYMKTADKHDRHPSRVVTTGS